ncbi:MAG: hypothetical protein LM580_11420 [Thermofilum sp.]|nr:hypothetical protein [Thermofilum sp.]
MVPLKYLVWGLALVAATGIAAYFVANALFKSEPLYGWEDAIELKRVLLAGRATLPFDAYLEQRVLLLNVTLDGVKYALKLSRVLVLFKARSAPVYEDRLPLLWRAWGNGTHAGAASFADLADDGSVVTVRYVALPANAPKRSASVCFKPAQTPDYVFSSLQGGSVDLGSEAFTWTGRREVRVVRLEVVSCGG